jgi:hypothetical protein
LGKEEIMNKLGILAAASALSLISSIPAFAAEESSATTASPSSSSATSTHEHGAISGPMSMSSTEFRGEHSMSGKITKIDHSNGRVTVKTGEGNLDVHFPPQSIANLKKGDEITVHLGYSEGAGAAGMQKGVGSATGMGEKTEHREGTTKY